MSVHVFDLLRDAGTMLGTPAIIVGLGGWLGGDALPDPGFAIAPTVQVPAGMVDVAKPGEFLRDGRPVGAPVARIGFDGQLTFHSHYEVPYQQVLDRTRLDLNFAKAAFAAGSP